MIDNTSITKRKFVTDFSHDNKMVVYEIKCEWCITVYFNWFDFTLSCKVDIVSSLNGDMLSRVLVRSETWKLN